MDWRGPKIRFLKALIGALFVVGFCTGFDYAPHSLLFPVKLLKSQDQFGAVLHQLQDRSGSVYYHSGLDIRTELHQEVTSPVAGRLVAGFYSYVDAYDGSQKKHFVSLQEVLAGRGVPPEGTYYFEIAVVDRFGNRFEFHHIDSSRIPRNIAAKVLRGGQIEKGETLGYVVETKSTVLGLDYNHLHYNIVSRDGVYINPLYVSLPVVDQVAPKIQKIYATEPSSCGRFSPQLREILDEQLASTKDLLVIEAEDQMSLGILKQPPTRVLAKFGETSQFEWDFSEALIDAKGALPNLGELYLRNSCEFFGADKKSSLLVRATTNHRFFIQIPVPKGFKGSVKISVFDEAGNSAERRVFIFAR